MKHIPFIPLALSLFLLFTVMSYLPALAQTYYPFPDTGQTKCYNNTSEITCPQPGQPFYGQDAQYQPRLPRSYTKLGHGGVILTDNALHVDEDGPWIMTKDKNQTADLTLTYFDAQGGNLGSSNTEVGPGQRMVGTPDNLNFPEGTEWFMAQASQPVTGFELFGTMDRNQLAGYSVVNLAATSGVFPKLERSGWTGIAFVNIGGSTASVTLEARNDAGNVIASRSMSLASGQKSVDVAEDLFTQSIAGATYVRFTSNQPVVGFQLNGSADRTMLDALPALGATHVGTQQLYFPHIAAE